MPTAEYSSVTCTFSMSRLAIRFPDVADEKYGPGSAEPEMPLVLSIRAQKSHLCGPGAGLGPAPGDPGLTQAASAPARNPGHRLIGRQGPRNPSGYSPPFCT